MQLLFNKNILLNGSMALTLTSNIQDLSTTQTCAVEVDWSGTSPIGTVVVQGSVSGNSGTFQSIGSLAVSGNTGTNLFNLSGVGYPFLQVQYIPTSGTGTLNVFISAKA